MINRDDIIGTLEGALSDLDDLDGPEKRVDAKMRIESAIRSLESAEPKTKNLGLCDVGVVGSVDGMGEKHSDGNYQLLVLHDKDGRRIEARVANGALEAELVPQPGNTMDTLAEASKDDYTVNQWASEIKEKMAESRAKGRYGWDDRNLCSDESISYMLANHLTRKNARNYVDIAILALMLHTREALPLSSITDLEVHF